MFPCLLINLLTLCDPCHHCHAIYFEENDEQFFLVKGDINALAERVRWMGIKDGDRWRSIGRVSAIFISSGTLSFFGDRRPPASGYNCSCIAFLPVVLFAAMLNAFNEEMSYKASFLSVLEDVVGRNQALC